jgi:hypothetical protein
MRSDEGEDNVIAFVDTVLRGLARGNASSAPSRLSVSLLGTGPAIGELLERCPRLESLQVGFVQDPASTSDDAAPGTHLGACPEARPYGGPSEFRGRVRSYVFRAHCAWES